MKYKTKMEIVKVKMAIDSLKKYDHLSKEDDYIQVTEWNNGEGWDISFSNKQFSLTYGELEAINHLIKCLDYNKDEVNR